MRWHFSLITILTPNLTTRILLSLKCNEYITDGWLLLNALTYWLFGEVLITNKNQKTTLPILLVAWNRLVKISAGANQNRTRVIIRKSQTFLSLLAGDPHHFSGPFVARIHLLWKWGNRWIWKGYKTANVDILETSLTSLRFPANRWERPNGPKNSCWDYTMFTDNQETNHNMKSRLLWKLYLIVNFSSFSASNLTEEFT